MWQSYLHPPWHFQRPPLRGSSAGPLWDVETAGLGHASELRLLPYRHLTQPKPAHHQSSEERKVIPRLPVSELREEKRSNAHTPSSQTIVINCIHPTLDQLSDEWKHHVWELAMYEVRTTPPGKVVELTDKNADLELKQTRKEGRFESYPLSWQLRDATNEAIEMLLEKRDYHLTCKCGESYYHELRKRSRHQKFTEGSAVRTPFDARARTITCPLVLQMSRRE
ncbi:hypothetical protein T439DRAFT_321390 [Meredithblackwellia eburnea MCA 4105]